MDAARRSLRSLQSSTTSSSRSDTARRRCSPTSCSSRSSRSRSRPGTGSSSAGRRSSSRRRWPCCCRRSAWLLADAQNAYEVARALNAAVMASAVFPVYWLARQLTSRRAALLAAVAAVVAPGLLYHSYLMTDAAGYPAFLLAVAVMTRALARPSRGWEVAVVGVSLLAVLTRTQFVVLPLAYLVAVAVVGRVTGEGVFGSYRRHRLSCGNAHRGRRPRRARREGRSRAVRRRRPRSSIRSATSCAGSR